jgi:hypothetical protein
MDANDPMDAIEPNDPTDPIESTDPVEQMESTESVDRIDHRDLLSLALMSHVLMSRSIRQRLARGKCRDGSHARGVVIGRPEGESTHQRPPALVNA